MPGGSSRSGGFYVALALILGVALYLGVHSLWFDLNILPVYLGKPLDAGIALIDGLILSAFFERMIAARKHNGHGLAMMRLLVRLAIYSVTGAVVLGTLGVKNLAIGGATVTIILGLAGQTVLSNLLAGVLLAIWKPFDVGDHVTIVAWQYPVLAPTFPHEAVLPGYSGRITDMDVMYTKCITDDGVPMVIPNGVMVSAAIQNHARAGSFRHRWRFDVTLDLDPRAALTAVEAALDRAASSVGLDPQSVAGYVEATDIGTAVFSIVVHFHVASTQEQRLRAAIVREVACGIRALRAPADAVPKA